MKIYHGSYTEIPLPKLQKTKFTKDFGTGFYCTKYYQQAKRWAARFDDAVINTYFFTKSKELKILEFNDMNDVWLDFVVDCRHGKSHNYDIVIGAMAKFNYPTHQIAFCTKKALNTIKFLLAKTIKP